MPSTAYGGQPPGLTGTHYGMRSIGVPGSLIPSDGESGASYLYNDLSLPADLTAEVYGPILTWPVGLAVFLPLEDGSFTAAGPDGVYTFTYRLYAAGVDRGITQSSITIGTIASGVLTGTIALDALSVSGALGASAALSGAIALDPMGASGVIIGGGIITGSLGAARRAGRRVETSRRRRS